MKKLLLVEDDRTLSETLIRHLDQNGYCTAFAYTKEDAVMKIRNLKFDLILLDITLPDGNGFAVCEEIRQISIDTRIIFLTVKDLENDILKGYNMGADDYVTKPFSLPVLYAKAMALTGRVMGKAGGEGVFLEAGDLKADVRKRQVWRGSQLLSLPPKEYDMLLFFLENPGRIFNREQLLIRFWGYEFDGNQRVVDNHIKKLRKAIGSCGCTIETVRKSGYRLEVGK